ncbi:MAG: HEAT repeat domain-containing protein [Deltaproteobacteria bacterium]|nr:HEAT repeat domain-containing protein [Deltaproteobacteria bacterium]
MTEVDKIVALLADPATERRAAAAIVLGAIGAKGSAVVDGLLGLVASDEPVLVRHALDALASLGPRKAAPPILPLVISRDPEVRQAAERALVAIGESIVPLVRERMGAAAPDEQRALSRLLRRARRRRGVHRAPRRHARLRGDPRAALAIRQQVRAADPAQRRKYLAETERFLKAQRKVGEHPGAVAAAVKVLGFLEDPKAIPTLLDCARAADQPPAVRQEAIIALRFALTGSATPTSELIDALVAAACAEDRALAQTALLTLGGLALSAEQALRIRKLTDHPDFDRARLAIEHLGRQKDPGAAKVLVAVVERGERRRAELAVTLLAGKPDVGAALAKALAAATDADRAKLLARALAPRLRELTPALRKQLRSTGLERLASGEPGAEAILDAARMADPGAVADELRALAARQRKANHTDDALRTLGVLCRADQASDDDRYQRASLELARASRERGGAVRPSDAALSALAQLASRGFDVGAALRKDKAISLDDLYHVGFHFAERGQPLGIELLEAVIAKGGRTKLGKMARNKLALSGAD